MENYTTIEQSKRLTEAGLNPMTADMHYHTEEVLINKLPEKGIKVYPAVNKHNKAEYHYPCWSSGALIKLMPDMIGRNKEFDSNGRVTYKEDNKRGASVGFLSINKNHEGEWTISYDDGMFECVLMDPDNKEMSYNYAVRMNEDLVDVAVDMVIWLIENGFINLMTRIPRNLQFRG